MNFLIIYAAKIREDYADWRTVIALLPKFLLPFCCQTCD
jgi:hypothetical protein